MHADLPDVRQLPKLRSREQGNASKRQPAGGKRAGTWTSPRRASSRGYYAGALQRRGGHQAARGGALPNRMSLLGGFLWFEIPRARSGLDGGRHCDYPGPEESSRACVRGGACDRVASPPYRVFCQGSATARHQVRLPLWVRRVLQKQMLLRRKTRPTQLCSHISSRTTLHLMVWRLCATTAREHPNTQPFFSSRQAPWMA